MMVLVVVGSSGGHIFPALSFIDALKDKYPQVGALLILPKRNFIDRLQLAEYKVRYISISPITLRPNFKNLIAILGFLKGSLESFFIMLEFRPDIVVGFGSIVCLPLILLAWIFRIKILIHEQNVIPGRANRFLAGFADIIAVSFKDSMNYFKNRADKIALTGNPIRRGLKRIDKNEALDFFGLEDNKFTILVMGGSQGSHRLNAGFLKAVSSKASGPRIQVVHLSGVKDLDFLKQGYRDLNLDARLFSFLKDMHYAYSAADLLVSRCGATTIAEAMFFRLPALIVPYPFAYAHQLKNAQVLAELGCALIIKDSELDTDKLRQVLAGLLNNPDKISLMRYNYNNIPQPDAGNLLVGQAMSLV